MRICLGQTASALLQQARRDWRGGAQGFEVLHKGGVGALSVGAGRKLECWRRRSRRWTAGGGSHGYERFASSFGQTSKTLYEMPHILFGVVRAGYHHRVAKLL